MINRAKHEFVDVAGGRIAYEVIGHGPLVVLSPGIGDTRSTYRFLAPLIANAGYRVASVDLRGHGESSTGWDSYSRTDTAGDLIEVIRKLGGPAMIVGQSFSGGSATIAAATKPESGERDRGNRPVHPPTENRPGRAICATRHHRRGVLLLVRFIFAGNVKAWSKYLDLAYPGASRPTGTPGWLRCEANLSEPGRVKAAQKMASSKPVGRCRTTG